MTNEHKCNDDDCGCEDEMYSVEEMVYGAHDKIDALIDLLIEKKVITEDEYSDKIQAVLAEYDDEDEDSEEDSEDKE